MADTTCTSHTLTDTVEHTQSVQIDWGDGDKDTIQITSTAATPVDLSHTYATSDTFIIAYTVVGYGIPSEGVEGCERMIDTNYFAVFRPAPSPAYTWKTSLSTVEPLQDTLLNCLGAELTLSQTNDSISYFVTTSTQGKDTSAIDQASLSLPSGWQDVILQSHTIYGCESANIIVIGISPRSTAIWQGDTNACQNQLALQGIKASTLLGSIDSITTNESLLLFESADSLSLLFVSATADVYTISATAYSSTGCIDTFSRKITLRTVPSTALAGDSIGCINTAIAYTPTVTSMDSTILTWYVDGILTTITAALPQDEHIPYETSSMSTGTRQVAAVVTTSYGQFFSRFIILTPVFYR